MTVIVVETAKLKGAEMATCVKETAVEIGIVVLENLLTRMIALQWMNHAPSAMQEGQTEMDFLCGLATSLMLMTFGGNVSVERVSLDALSMQNRRFGMDGSGNLRWTLCSGLPAQLVVLMMWTERIRPLPEAIDVSHPMTMTLQFCYSRSWTVEVLFHLQYHLRNSDQF